MAEADRAVNDVDDVELNDLLDNALLDFDRPSENPTSNSPNNEKRPRDEILRELEAGIHADLLKENPMLANAMVDDETMATLLSQFEETLKEVFSEGGCKDDPELTRMGREFNAQLQNITKETIHELASEAMESDNSQFSAAISETLKNFTENSEDIHANRAAFERLLASLGVGNIAGDMEKDADVEMTSIISGMMSTFLCKEMLYPSIKDLIVKFPKWIEKNKAKISDEDYERYEKQMEIMKKICVVYEAGKDTDSQEEKQKECEAVLALLQEMQEYGHPPNELIGGASNLPSSLFM